MNIIKPDVNINALFQGLAFHHMIQQNSVLREIAMLGYGTMVFKYCAVHTNCPSELVKVM